LAQRFAEGFAYTVNRKSAPCTLSCWKTGDMKRMCLDQHPLKVELAQQLFQHCPLVVLTGGVAGLADRHTQGC